MYSTEKFWETGTRMEGKSKENWMINSEDPISKQKELPRWEERKPKEGAIRHIRKSLKRKDPRLQAQQACSNFFPLDQHGFCMPGQHRSWGLWREIVQGRSTGSKARAGSEGPGFWVQWDLRARGRAEVSGQRRPGCQRGGMSWRELETGHGEDFWKEYEGLFVWCGNHPTETEMLVCGGERCELLKQCWLKKNHQATLLRSFQRWRIVRRCRESESHWCQVHGTEHWKPKKLSLKSEENHIQLSILSLAGAQSGPQ